MHDEHHHHHHNDHSHGHNHDHGHDHSNHRHNGQRTTDNGHTHRLGSWFRQNGTRIVLALFILYLISGIYYVPADQQALRIRFGRLLPERMQPGLHYSWPYPLEKVIRLKINEAQRLAIGASDLSRALGVNSTGADDYLLTGDQNLVRLQAWIQYYIQDPASYLYHAETLPGVVESLFFRCTSRAVGTRHVDDILTTERIALQNQVQQELQEEVTHLQLGITVTTVALEQVSPPEEVRDAFLDVANAREDRNRIVQEANGYSSELLPNARGKAQETLQQAEIYRTELINRSNGESERFSSLWQEYRDHHDVTTARLFLETMEQVLPKIRKVILDDSGKSKGLDLDIFEMERK
jgi:membrane protease subunit HflK